MKKPQLSFWQIWNMSFGFLGIQFGFALQNANVSRIFETLGANIDEIPILWIAAPVTGLIVQPIVGYLSDRTWNRLGRRRPFFLIGAILSSIALILMPNSPTLWIAAGCLWILDASINISMEPFRAFVGDMLPAEQRTIGFSMQSFFIGAGAIIASALPYIMTNFFNVSNTAPEGEIPLSVKLAFYLGSGVFLLSVLWTVFRTKEYSPEELSKFNVVKVDTPAYLEENLNMHKYYSYGSVWTAFGLVVIIAFYFLFDITDYGLYVLFFGCILFGILQLMAGWFAQLKDRRSKQRKKNPLVEIIDDFYDMPTTMKQLAVVQFFTWFALFSMWIYTTPAVTHHIFNAADTSSELYNKGADWVGILMAVYNGFAAIMAFVIIWMAKFLERKYIHMIALFIGGMGLISFYYITDPNLLLISELGIGLAWASILSMPYAILTGSLPSNKFGVYMGIFNFFIVIPQITAASILGFIMKSFFNNEAIYALIIGGISMILAAALVIVVKDEER